MKEVNQWNITLRILAGVLFLGALLFVLASMENPAFPLVTVITVLFCMHLFCREYMEDFVDLSKI